MKTQHHSSLNLLKAAINLSAVAFMFSIMLQTESPQPLVAQSLSAIVHAADTKGNAIFAPVLKRSYPLKSDKYRNMV